jgi:hypothetical protein
VNLGKIQHIKVCGVAKAVLRGKCIAASTHIKREEIFNQQSKLLSISQGREEGKSKQRKPISRSKELTKSRPNEMKKSKQVRKLSGTKSQ